MGELSGLPRAVAIERAHATLYYVGLGEARYREVQTFSLGMKQTAKLAQALVHSPRLIFLDEPTNGLDPTTSPRADAGPSRRRSATAGRRRWSCPATCCATSSNAATRS